MRIHIAVLLSLITLVLNSQTLDFGFGIRRDNNYLLLNRVDLSDSLRVIRPTNNTEDLREFIFLTYKTENTGKPFLRISAKYFRKFTTFHLQKDIARFNTTVTKVAFIASKSILISGEYGVKIFRKIEVSAGLGTAFHFNRKPLKFGFRDNSDMDLPYYHIQKIHKNVTLNYSFNIEYNIYHDFFLGLTKNGSLGEVTNNLEFNGSSYSIPVKWSSIGYFVSYRTDINDLFRK